MRYEDIVVGPRGRDDNVSLWHVVAVDRGHEVNVPKVSTFLVFSLCATATYAGRTDDIAAHLGYEGCKLSKPLTMLQVMAKDMSGGNGANRAHPDWDELIAKYASGDQIYFIDCRKADPTRIFAGTSLYVLVRDGTVIARAVDTKHD
jgi:hypothetical protein